MLKAQDANHHRVNMASSILGSRAGYSGAANGKQSLTPGKVEATPISFHTGNIP
jgi:hypothetical protein